MSQIPRSYAQPAITNREVQPDPVVRLPPEVKATNVWVTLFCADCGKQIFPTGSSILPSTPPEIRVRATYDHRQCTATHYHVIGEFLAAAGIDSTAKLQEFRQNIDAMWRIPGLSAAKLEKFMADVQALRDLYPPVRKRVRRRAGRALRRLLKP